MNRTRSRWWVPASLLLSGAALFGLSLLASPSQAADEIDAKVLEAENKRVATIDKVKPTVVAIFAPGQRAGENAHPDTVNQLHQQIGDRFAVIQDIPSLNLSQAQSEVQAVRRCRHLSFSPLECNSHPAH